MAGSWAIEAEGLRKSYKDVEALCGIDLQVETGTVLGLLGPNGAGKTTAVRIMTTLLPPSGGSARVAGLDVVTEAAELRSKIGLAGQYAAVDENLTGFENLDMVGRLYHMGRAAAAERASLLLDRFELSEAGDRLVKTYSGGMRRRLDLAAALVARPEVLFLDEPTTGLDPRSRIGLWEVIEARVAQGSTVLLTTQYLDEADRLADRIAVIDHGTLIAEGSSDELKERVGGERIEVKLEDPSQAAAAIEALAELAATAVGRRGHGASPDPRAQRGDHPAVRKLDAAGIEIDDISVRRPTLDDAFLTLTGRPPEPEDDGVEQDTGEHETQLVAMTARYAISDTLVLAMRALRRIPRNPELLTSYTVQPIMFTLLFVYVFGGAIQTPGYENYADFLIPGIIVQQMSFGGFATALGLVEDLKKGLVDRFRSLPMSRMAVLTGRTLSDIAMNALALTVMVAVGYIVGFGFSTSPLEVVGGIGLCLLIGYAFSWVFAYVGLLASTPEAANAFGFIAIFPLTFASSAFVPPETMPDWLQTFAADINPFSIMVDAVRALFVGGPAGNDVWGAAAWCVGLIAVFGSLSIHRYRQAVVR